LNPQGLVIALPLKHHRDMAIKDFAQNALRVVEISTGETLIPHEKNAAAVELGRRGGLKGGRARAAKLTEEQRQEIARNAAKTRWKSQKAAGK
jgi:hypothetical protein